MASEGKSEPVLNGTVTETVTVGSDVEGSGKPNTVEVCVSKGEMIGAPDTN